jgi:hypothetical protein
VLIAGLCIVHCELIAWLVLNILIPESDFERLRLLRFFSYTSPFSLLRISVFSARRTTLLVIVLSIKLADKVGRARWLKPLVATAQMTLTLYIGHIGVFQLFLLISGSGEGEYCLGFAWLWAAIFCPGAFPFFQLLGGSFRTGTV